jgi:glycosyltransferase involved in cell wall biosynthesis
LALHRFLGYHINAMDVFIAYPEQAGVVTGNFCSALQWAEILVALGHKVESGGSAAGKNAELLIALNAEKMHHEISLFSRNNPGSRIVVILTGTDIYPAVSDLSMRSMEIADRLVALQANASKVIPDALHEKLTVIVQSVEPSPITGTWEMDPEAFNVALVANLRAVKDPFLAAAAARRLPGQSRTSIRHAGFPLDCGSEERAREESADNLHYEWLGGLTPAESRALISSSDVLLVTSRNEGAGRVIGEAVADGTPIIATRIEGITGLVGDDYGGLFPVGDVSGLAALLARAENDDVFLEELSRSCRELVPLFDPGAEMQAWEELVTTLA